MVIGVELNRTDESGCFSTLQPLILTEKVQPICLAQRPEPPPRTDCFITGWGVLVAGDPNSLAQKLMEGNVKIWTDEECSAGQQLDGVGMYLIRPEAFCTSASPKTT
ncbi:hypothetical protein RvY_01912 [Ramazzottius varieornatus]|uniref:Peptidase S1 domain-containing protein n=1 Tax=Ramazzottius varieornatus TaxID=947166 RepID=A0A1D1ULS4_RAMVA|nr:hypothetical protein RvY_01912 [Ramazzottius varieornatus]